jgi:hypothetical protein
MQQALVSSHYEVAFVHSKLIKQDQLRYSSEFMACVGLILSVTWYGHTVSSSSGGGSSAAAAGEPPAWQEVSRLLPSITPSQRELFVCVC